MSGDQGHGVEVETDLTAWLQDGRNRAELAERLVKEVLGRIPTDEGANPWGIPRPDEDEHADDEDG